MGPVDPNANRLSVGWGRVLLAAGMACFGLHFLFFVARPSLPAPGPPWSPGAAATSVLGGVLLLIAAVGLLVRRAWPWTALLLGLGLLLRVFAVHLPQMLRNVHDPGPWTTASEIWGMSAGALALAAVGLEQPLEGSGFRQSHWMRWAARVLFAGALAVYGVQHLLYAGFVASLVPKWVPWPMFWAVFFGLAFFAAALAVLIGVGSRLACRLTGAMFLLWLVTLHIPLTVAAPRDGTLWTSAFVPLALAGASFAMAGVFARGVERERLALNNSWRADGESRGAV